MKMTYDDFEPGKYYNNTATVWLCGKGDRGKCMIDVKTGSTFNLNGLFDYTGFRECDRDGNLLEVAPEPAVGQVWRGSGGFEFCINKIKRPDGSIAYIGASKSIGSSIKDIVGNAKYVRTLAGFDRNEPCSECERLKAQVENLERKLKQKENQRSRMQSQRDHMSQKLAELTGLTPKEVRDGVKLLALGIKDKLAVKQDPDMVTFDGIPGKWFPYTDGDTVPFHERTLFQTITESERVCPSDWDAYEHYFNVYNWDDIVAYRPADREDMR